MSSDGLEVVGGAHDIEADIDDMEAAGAQIRRTGLDVGEIAVGAHGVIIDANLLSSVVLSPGSFARAEGAVLDALDGGGGLSETAIRMTAAGLTMQGRAQAYYLFDQAQQFGAEVRHWAQGTLLVGAALTPAGLSAIVLLLWSDDAFEDPEAYLVSHPDLLEEIVASSPFTLGTLTGGAYPSTVAQAASLVAALYDNGEATVEMTGHSDTDDVPSDMARSLVRLDSFDEAGTFQIQMSHAPDGTPVYNVYLPGTKDFDGFWDQSDLIQNMGTNLAAVAGDENAYEDAVIKAMAQARVPTDARIMLTGHSQGGIVAARLAQKMTDPDSGYPQYNVTNVLTAGSPVDHIEVAESVSVLSLVNEYDIVPRLDGEGYDDSSNHTTIVTRHQTGTATGNHMLNDTYVPMALDLAESSDPAVVDSLDAVNDFYARGDNETWTFSMERQ